MSDLFNKVGNRLLKDVAPYRGQTIYFLKQGNGIGEGVIEGSADGDLLSIRAINVDDVAVEAILHEHEESVIPRDKVFSTPEGVIAAYLAYFKEQEEEQKQEKKSEMLKGIANRNAWNMATSEDDYDNITDKNIYKKVVSFIHDFLGEYEIRGRCQIDFETMRNASYREGGKVDSGDISVGLNIRTLSGVNLKTGMIIPVREGMLIEPSIIFFEGSPRIIAQSTFDQIVGEKTFSHQQFRNQEHIVSPEMLKMYQDSKITTINPGVFNNI